MRFFVLVLLVLLLPLRSGLGEALAAAGLHHGAPHQQQQAGPHLFAGNALALEDCAGHEGTHDRAQLEHPEQHANGSDQANPGVDAACDACSFCQICHAVGLAFSQVDIEPLPVPHARPEALSTAFVSAPDARDQKPPIS
jgi:hypothetical protein